MRIFIDLSSYYKLVQKSQQIRLPFLPPSFVSIHTQLQGTFLQMVFPFPMCKTEFLSEDIEFTFSF